MVLKQGLCARGVSGSRSGFAASLALVRVLQAYLYDTAPTDPLTFVVVAAAFLLAGALAALGPAWRATRVDPMVALRAEYVRVRRHHNYFVPTERCRDDRVQCLTISADADEPRSNKTAMSSDDALEKATLDLRCRDRILGCRNLQPGPRWNHHGLERWRGDDVRVSGRRDSRQNPIIIHEGAGGRGVMVQDSGRCADARPAYPVEKRSMVFGIFSET